MNAPRAILLLLCVSAVREGVTAPAPPTAATLLKADDLRADVAVLRRAYTTLHPGLYRYNTPAQVEQAFTALEKEFARDRTLADAYLAFSVFAARVKCGHTYANFFNQSKETQAALFRAGRVPFHFRWLDGRMIVTRSFAEDSRLKPGSEILSINGTPVRTILARLLTLARADGSNDDKRVASMEAQGLSRYEAFDVFFPLLFPSSATRMTFQVRAPGERRVRELALPPMTYEQRVAAMPGAVAGGSGEDAPVFEYRTLEDGIAYLRMPTWAFYNSKWDWQAFLEQTFASLAAGAATDLVLDLRGNEGGQGVGDVIAAHLTTEPVTQPRIRRLTRYRSVPEDLRPFLDTWDRSFFDWGTAATEAVDGFFTLRRNAGDDVDSVIEPVAPTFRGRTWVLLGAENSSATFEFAQLVQRNRLATLVGQPTGGNQRGINGGAFFFLRLPRSGIELDLPLIGQFAEGDPPDAGLRPDIAVTPSAKDIASGRDAELEAVRAQIRRGRTGDSHRAAEDTESHRAN